MIILYLSLFLLLGLTKVLINWRVRSLEKKYAKMASAAKTMSQRPQYKSGTSNKPRDSYQFAKHQYELGRLVQKRDRIEEKYSRWQVGSDRVGKVMTGLRSLKGRTVPYAMGMIDLVVVALLLDHFGIIDNLSIQSIKDSIASLFS